VTVATEDGRHPLGHTRICTHRTGAASVSSSHKNTLCCDDAGATRDNHALRSPRPTQAQPATSTSHLTAITNHSNTSSTPVAYQARRPHDARTPTCKP
jgi:hypothetical protein